MARILLYLPAKDAIRFAATCKQFSANKGSNLSLVAAELYLAVAAFEHMESEPEDSLEDEEEDDEEYRRASDFGGDSSSTPTSDTVEEEEDEASEEETSASDDDVTLD